MSLLTLLLLSSLAVGLFLTAILLVNTIRRNFQTGQDFRRHYAEQIESLRFGAMLKRHNVNLQQLLHNRPIADIDTQIKNCRACSKTAECDRLLYEDVVPEQGSVFCPNHFPITK